jgi:Zn-dependent peptidase ImmA (M78 family)
MKNRIEHEASKLLHDLGMMSVPVSVKRIIKEQNIKLSSFDLGQDISGVLVIEKGKAKIGYNPSESSVRQRFTLAHELGHYILHREENENKLFVDDNKVMFRRKNLSQKELKQEREANSFAAALLMPEELILIEFEKLNEDDDFISDEKIIKKLAFKFMVSEIAMTYRLMNLNVLTH